MTSLFAKRRTMFWTQMGTDVVGEETCNELRSLIMGMEKEDTLDRLFQMMTEPVKA